MEGMILAAGMGTRLGELTQSRPKALVEVDGRPLLARVIDRLAEAGCRHIVVNMFCMADMVADYLARGTWPVPISVSDERPLLRDTGGALRKAAPLFWGDGEVLLHNVDVLSSIDLQALVAQHREERNLATLCCSHRDTRRMLLFGQGCLKGRVGEVEEAEDDMRLAFSGISLISSEVLRGLPHTDQPFPLIEGLLGLSREQGRVGCFCHEARQWLDVGRPETLRAAHQFLIDNNIN